MAASKSSRSNDDERHDPLISVDLDDAEGIVVERLGLLVAAEVRARMRTRCSPRVAMASDVVYREADVGGCPQTFDRGISAMSEPGVHHPTAIVDGKVVWPVFQ